MWKLCLLVLAAFVLSTEAVPSPRRRRKVVVDVDTGSDDAMAMLMLLSKETTVDVVAVTCVSGNTGLSNVTRNVLKTLEVAKRLDIPVYAGSPQGLVYAEVTDSFWGSDGFGDFSANYPVDLSNIKDEHSALALAKIVKTYPDEVTILALGPLTNIAIAGHINNEFFEQMKNMVILGGSVQGSGNVKPGVEFNFYADPEAAEYVFSRARPEYAITIVPMETIEKAAYPLAFRTDVLGRIKSPAIEFLNKAEAKAWPKMNGKWECFDQMAAGVVLDPNIVKSSMKRKINVETHGGRARGVVLVDHRSVFRPITIVTEVDKEKLAKLLIKNLS